jgi:hypothetical protein
LQCSLPLELLQRRASVTGHLIHSSATDTRLSCSLVQAYLGNYNKGRSVTRQLLASILQEILKLDAHPIRHYQYYLHTLVSTFICLFYSYRLVLFRHSHTTPSSLYLNPAMCDYTQVQYKCSHLRYTVRAWCTKYQQTHVRCRVNVVAK